MVYAIKQTASKLQPSSLIRFCTEHKWG